MALFEPSECDSTTPFRGDKAKALETAKSALVGHGFEKWWAYVAPLAPWLILSPIMARWIEGRTKKALDTLVRSMAVTAGSPAVGPTIQSPN